MPKYEYADGVYALNSYLNKALQVNMGWSPVTYTNSLGQTVRANPIIPSQQEREFLNSGKDFIVFSSAVQPNRSLWGITDEVIVYRVWSDSATSANDVANFIRDLFRNRDENADAVNSWLDQEALSARGDRHVSFLAIRTGLIEKAEPSESEDGWVSASVTVDTMYTTKNHAPITRFTFP